jgi:hypothetical protein
MARGPNQIAEITLLHPDTFSAPSVAIATPGSWAKNINSYATVCNIDETQLSDLQLALLGSRAPAPGDCVAL